MRPVRLGNVDWSAVYMVEHHPAGSAGQETAARVLLYADARGAEPGRAAAVVADPKDVAAALDLAGNDPRFQAFHDFWIDVKKLRHTRPGSTALLSFALTGGRIATVAVPSQVLQQIQKSRQTRSAARTPASKPNQRPAPALVS